MKRAEITYLTMDIGRTYAAALRGCDTVDQLRRELADNWPYCADAIEQAARITDADWTWAKKHARHEKHGQRVNDLAGAILLPAILLKMSLASQRFCAPDGTCLIRLLEVTPAPREER